LANETPTPIEQILDPIELLEINMQKWADSDVGSYEITVIFFGTFFQKWGYEIVVVNNKIIEVSNLCFPDSNCGYFYKPNNITIPGLFDFVRSEFNNPPKNSWDPESLYLDYLFFQIWFSDYDLL
jgi:hypothetical protein